MKAQRIPAIAAIILILATAGLIDRHVHRPSTEVSADVQTPMGAGAGARSSAWYCAGATASNDGAANGTLVVANSGTRPLSGTLTVIPSEGDPKTMPLDAPANGRTVVKLTDVLTAPYASALVELDGGGAVVDLVGTGTYGETVTPCASNASTSWYFAEGVTTKDATEVITLFNPFPEDAVVDLVFQTEEGEVTPQALMGMSVKGRGMTAINVGEHVQRREQVSTRISARAGRLIAARLQTFDGTNGPKGVSLTLGAAAAGDVWYFPEGYLSEGLTERFQLYNPGTQEARAQVELMLEEGSAEPILLTVPAESRVSLVANDEARIPKNVPHAVTVRSANGVGLVVERTVSAGSPSSRAGVAITLGARMPSRTAIVAAGQADDNNEEWLVLQNPGSAAATFSATLLDGSSGTTPSQLDRVQVPAHQRREIKLNDILPKGATALLVASDHPLVVERDYYKTKGPGIAMSPATPLRET